MVTPTASATSVSIRVGAERMTCHGVFQVSPGGFAILYYHYRLKRGARDAKGKHIVVDSCARGSG
jgi:hypothetical protein